jgi:hypothetical protein
MQETILIIGRQYRSHPVCTVYTALYFGNVGRGGGGEPDRSGNSSQIWVENTNMTDCISTG